MSDAATAPALREERLRPPRFERTRLLLHSPAFLVGCVIVLF